MELLSQHRPSSISLQMSTPTKLMRKLSHSKIIGHHLPHLLSKGDTPIISASCLEKGGGTGADASDAQDGQDPAPQMKRIEKDLKSRLRRLPGGKYLGLIFALLTSLTMSLMTLVVKSMPQYHAFSLVLWRLQGVLLPSIVLLGYFGGRSGKSTAFEGVLSARWKILALLVVSLIISCFFCDFRRKFS